MYQKIDEMFLISLTTAFEMIAVYSTFYEENTCHRQSICKQTVLRF